MRSLASSEMWSQSSSGKSNLPAHASKAASYADWQSERKAARMRVAQSQRTSHNLPKNRIVVVAVKGWVEA